MNGKYIEYNPAYLYLEQNLLHNGPMLIALDRDNASLPDLNLYSSIIGYRIFQICRLKADNTDKVDSFYNSASAA